MKILDHIIIHCSASDLESEDSIEAVERLHTAKKGNTVSWGGKEFLKTESKFRAVGYHFFINKQGDREEGRPLAAQGAHCFGHNERSIGICFSGNKLFTKDQFVSFVDLMNEIYFDHHSIREQAPLIKILPHRDFNSKKTCPNFINKMFNKDLEDFHHRD